MLWLQIVNKLFESYKFNYLKHPYKWIILTYKRSDWDPYYKVLHEISFHYIPFSNFIKICYKLMTVVTFVRQNEINSYVYQHNCFASNNYPETYIEIRFKLVKCIKRINKCCYCTCHNN